LILFQIHPLTQTIYVLTNNTKIEMEESLNELLTGTYSNKIT